MTPVNWICHQVKQLCLLDRFSACKQSSYLGMHQSVRVRWKLTRHATERKPAAHSTVISAGYIIECYSQ